MSVDPLVSQTDQPYAFTGDNPLNATDPLGMKGGPGIVAWYVNEACGHHPHSKACRGAQKKLYTMTHPKSSIVDDIFGYLTIGMLGVSGVALVGAAGSAVAAGSGATAVVAASNAAASDDTDGNPLTGTAYTSKVLSQMANGDYHGFPSLIDGLARSEDAVAQLGGDGTLYTHVNVPGYFNGVSGDFVYIVDGNGMINHRMFEPNE